MSIRADPWFNFSRLEKLFEIIHEDADLLAVHKPADLVCHPTKGDEYSSLISRARIYLERRNATARLPKPKLPVTPHLIHRLDRETSGIVLLAKNFEAARELGKVWETRTVSKEYLAIVHGHVAAVQGMIDAPLGKDVNSPIAIKDCVRPDGAAAQTEFAVEQRFTRSGEEFKIKNAKLKKSPATSPGGVESNGQVSAFRFSTLRSAATEDGPLSAFSLLRIRPRTGRKHQIRIHLAHLGHPIVGDKIYGGDVDLYLALVESRLTDAQREKLILPNHALHAGRLSFAWREQEYDFHSPPEPWFTQFVSTGLPC